MAADKRSIFTDALETLGTVITENEKRDAIHLAVEPVVAGCWLYPGAHIGIASDGLAYGKGPKFIGIVDPFLTEPVKKGERFWLVVYPRQITSLRHVWTHPDIDIDHKTRPISKKEASEIWLRNFIATNDCPDYETLIAGALDNSKSWDADYLHFNGDDAHGDIPPEFWDHIENVTERTIPNDQRAKYFSCSC